MKEYHILNGDALKSQLKELDGEKIVIRECLVEGEVQGENMEEILKARFPFFENNYQISQAEYQEKGVKEISRIKDIPSQAVVNLWFENDLFCQVNLWFTISSLIASNPYDQLFLVSPATHSWKGFGALNHQQLVASYHARKPLPADDQYLIKGLWQAFQKSDWVLLRKNAKALRSKIEEIEAVIEAHIERFPDDGQPGRPQRSLHKIIKELETPTEAPDFGKVFQAFSEQEGIYGFGDLQVKRIMDEFEV